jgi:NAD(P)-dependent dehydrogenase (short-subunit alcohol dehydrogenase family)
MEQSEMSKPWTTGDIPSQKGKRTLVTGATSGIGWNTALELARAGAEVTIPARTQAKSGDAATRIRAVIPQAKIKTAVMDVSSLDSVRELARQQVEDTRPIDLLINNAGVMALPDRRLSVDGFELQFATNVLGHFALTGLLLESILRAAAPRVVTVASYAHENGGPVPIQDLNSEMSYKPIRAYSKTKLANVLFGRELQRRAGRRLLSTTCHPGYARTKLNRDTTFIMNLFGIVLWPLSQSSAGSAMPTLFAATSPDAKPAAYYGPDGLFLGLRGNVKETQMGKFAYDEAAARRLFDQLQELTGVKYAL